MLEFDFGSIDSVNDQNDDYAVPDTHFTQNEATHMTQSTSLNVHIALPNFQNATPQEISQADLINKS